MRKRLGAVRASRHFMFAALFGLVLTPLAPDAGSHAETRISTRIATAHYLAEIATIGHPR